MRRSFVHAGLVAVLAGCANGSPPLEHPASLFVTQHEATSEGMFLFSLDYELDHGDWCAIDAWAWNADVVFRSPTRFSNLTAFLHDGQWHVQSRSGDQGEPVQVGPNEHIWTTYMDGPYVVHYEANVTGPVDAVDIIALGHDTMELNVKLDVTCTVKPEIRVSKNAVVFDSRASNILRLMTDDGITAVSDGRLDFTSHGELAFGIIPPDAMGMGSFDLHGPATLSYDMDRIVYEPALPAGDYIAQWSGAWHGNDFIAYLADMYVME